MVGNAGGVAGAGVGAEGFFAGMNVIASEQKGDAEDTHGRIAPAGRYIDMVDEVPLAVVLDGALAAVVKVHVRRRQSGLQEAEHRIVRGVIEVAAGDDSVDADSRQRIRQEPQPLHGYAPTRLRLSRSPVLGRMVVHQHGECGTVRRLSSKNAQQDIPRGHHVVCIIEMTWF